ncbi:MAG: hypothetical protein ACLQVJ_05580 [Syntrophobacteraceae bacterium]
MLTAVVVLLGAILLVLVLSVVVVWNKIDCIQSEIQNLNSGADFCMINETLKSIKRALGNFEP